MTDPLQQVPRPGPSDGLGMDAAPAAAGIDPEDTEIVPAALQGMVTSAQTTHRVMQTNGCYPATAAVTAVEDTVAALARISRDLEPYAGDYSSQGGNAVARAGDLLDQARSALSDARHHLALDELSQPAPIPQETAALSS